MNKPTKLPGTPAEREAIRALAEKTIVERLEGGTVVGHTESGRVKSVRGPEGPWGRMWEELGRQMRSES